MCRVINNTTKYPVIDNDSLAVMEFEAWAKGDLRVLFPYARTCDKGWYVDIYIYIKDEESFKRIILEPQIKLKSRDKTQLWGSHYYYTGFSEREAEFFMAEIAVLAPELNMKKYSNIRDALCHVYYASHEENLREQLYKSQLDFIARNFCYIKDIKKSTSNIEDAFGLPLSLIRKMNSEFGIYTGLVDREARERAAHIYRNYHGMLNDIEEITYFQWAYLHDCLHNGIVPDKDMLNKLSNIEVYYGDEDLDGEEVYEVYVPYKQNRRIVKDIYDISLPRRVNCFDHPAELYSICFLANELVKRGGEIDHQVAALYQEKEERFCYEDDRLFIRPPRSIKELVDEWRNQNNCLLFYILPVTEDKTSILFLRRKSAPDISHVTVEIRGNRLMQAYMRCDEPVKKEERDFLEEFCIKNGIEFHI